jgi:Big-like domain-containing protein
MDGVPSTPVLPFAELLEELRRQGFVIGVDQHLRLQQLLDRLADNVAPGRLKTHLAPIFATSREEQERFYRTFDRLYPVFTQAEVEQRRRESGAQAEPTPARPAPPPARRRVTVFTGIVLVLLLTLALWRLPRPHRTGTPARPDTGQVHPGPVPGPRPDTATAPDSVRPRSTPLPPVFDRDLAAQGETGFLARHRQGLRIVALFLVAGLFLLNEWRLYRRRRLVVSRERRQKPPFTWPVRLEAPINPFAESAELPNAARLLRQRQPGELARLSVEETVRATIAAAGFPTFRYRTDTRAPDYLLLIERSAFRDHGARLYQALAQALEREGVHVTRYLHDGDPRVCHAERGEQRELLVDLRRRYPDYRLLLVSRGDRLLDPVTGRLQPWTAQFLSWSDRALLTPESPSTWGLREVALAQHFVVLPATIAGLMGAVGHFRGPARTEPERWRELDASPGVPRLDDGDPSPRLRAYLGPRVFRWLCAVAVYPELHWDLTLHLAGLPILGPGLLTEESLLRLLRLPWFRQGAIPDEVRARLIDQLTEAEERAVREAIVDLLERNPAPGDSVSANRYELDLVVQRLALHRRDPRQRRNAIRELQGFPRRDLVQDFAMLKLIEETPASRLQVLLPRRLRRVFYRDGVPALGTRAAVRVAALVAALGAGARLTRPPATPPAPASRMAISPTYQGFGWSTEAVKQMQMVVGEETVLNSIRIPTTRERVFRLQRVPVTWASDAEAVAAVDREGRLAALAPGLATIRAISSEGDTAQLQVKVTPTEFAFESKALSLRPGDLRSLKMVVPSQERRELATRATRRLSWSVGDTSIVRITSPGVVLAVAPGKTSMTASGFGQEARLEISVSSEGVVTQGPEIQSAWNDTLSGILGPNLSQDGKVFLLVGERISLMGMEATRFKRRWSATPSTLALIDRGAPQPGGIGWGGSPNRPEQVTIHRDELVGLAPGTGVLALETEDGSLVRRTLVVTLPTFGFGTDSLVLSQQERRALPLLVPSQARRPLPAILRGAVRLASSDPGVVRAEGATLLGVRPGRAVIEGTGFGTVARLVVVVQPGSGAVVAEADKNNALDVYRRFVVALNRRDLAAALSLYPTMPPARQQAFRAMFRRGIATDTLNWSNGDLRLGRDTVTVVARYQRTMRDSLNAVYIHATSRSVRLARGPEGWRIVELSGSWDGPDMDLAMDSSGRRLRFVGPPDAQRAIEATLQELGQALSRGDLGALLRLYPDMPPQVRTGYEYLFRDRYVFDTDRWRLDALSFANDTALAGLAGRTDLVDPDGGSAPVGNAPSQVILVRQGDRWIIRSLGQPTEQREVPVGALSLYSRGLLQLDRGALPEARNSFLRALAVHPGYTAALRALDSLRAVPVSPPVDSGAIRALRSAAQLPPLRVPVGALVPVPLSLRNGRDEVVSLGELGLGVRSSDTSVARTAIEGERIFVKGVAPGEAKIVLEAGEARALIQVTVSPRDTAEGVVPPDAIQRYRQAVQAEARGDLAGAGEGYRDALRLAPGYAEASDALTRVVLTLRVGDWAKHLSRRSLSGLRQMYPTMPERDEAAWRRLLENPSVTRLTAVPRAVVVETAGEREARVQFTIAYTIDTRPSGRQTSASRYRAVFQLLQGAWIVTAMQGLP